MALLVRNISLAWDEPEENLPAHVARALRVPVAAVGAPGACRVLRRALDARWQDDIRRIYSVAVTLQGDEQRALRRGRAGQVAPLVVTPRPPIQPGRDPLPCQPVVIGSGPAGLFAALLLADLGYRPLVLERGQDAPLRHRARHLFYTTGQFDPENNLLFGLGGAGTYSDGKLYSRTRDPRNAAVLAELVRFGADPDILIDSKPHIGSDRLPGIVRKMVKHIVAAGGTVRFGAKVVDFELADNPPDNGPPDSSPQSGRLRRLVALRLESGERIAADLCILATGYSARDTYRVLAARGVELCAKPFQMGVRIEHPQEMISRSQYGAAATRLPPADYHLVAKGPRSPASPPAPRGGGGALW
ncbi:MAG: FAD-dependent monooxygenase, partial [Phycisphaeraceae bacterium]